MKRSITGFGNMNNATLQIAVVSVSLSQPFLTLHNMEAEFDPLYPHTNHYKGEVMVKENFTLTEDMKFGEAHALAILAYSIMFVVGLATNTISLVRMLQVREGDLGDEVDSHDGAAGEDPAQGPKQDDVAPDPSLRGRSHGEKMQIQQVQM